MLVVFVGDMLTSTPYMGLLNLLASKPSTYQELLPDLSIYSTVLRVIGRSKMNERFHDMTTNQDVIIC